MESKYSETVARLLVQGEPKPPKNEWIDYSGLGIGPAHIAELIRMACDEELNFANSESMEVWAPLHAWRALGQMKAAEAVDALLSQLNRIDENNDDWISDDFPLVFGRIGSPAIPALAVYIADSEKPMYARICALHCLEKIGEIDPVLRRNCVDILTGNLRNFASQHETVNAFIILYLQQLKAIESINEIRQAYLSERVDTDVIGDLEDVEICLDLRDKRKTRRKRVSFSPDNIEMLAGIMANMQATEDPEPDIQVPFINTGHRPGRNAPCPCGSGKKYKKCCLK